MQPQGHTLMVRGQRDLTGPVTDTVTARSMSRLDRRASMRRSVYLHEA